MFKKILIVVFTAVLIIGCEKKEFEIIDQDTTWKIDDKYVEEDIREQAGDILDGELVYLHSQQIITSGYSSEKSTELFDESMPLAIRLTRPIDKDLNVKLRINETNDSKLPDGFFYVPEICTIKAGETSGSVDIKYMTSAFLSEGEYHASISLESVDNEAIKISEKRSLLDISFTIKYSMNNIIEKDISSEGVFDDFTLTASHDVKYLRNIRDGIKVNSGWSRPVWNVYNPTDYLDFLFETEETIKGLIIYSESNQYYIPQFDVLVENNDGQLKHHGLFIARDGVFIHHVTFKEPVQTRRIRMANMTTQRRVALSEVEVIR